jgi:hypothetical protein
MIPCGLHRRFERIQQEPSSGDATSEPPTVALPNGELGSWNGGLLMGTAPPIVVGPRTHSLLEFAQSGPHFSFIWRTVGLANLTTAAVQAKGEAEFFGPLLPSQWKWFAAHGGWSGVAELARSLSVEVAALEWRTEGLVGLRAHAPATPTSPSGGSTSHGASTSTRTAVVITKPVRLAALPLPRLPRASGGGGGGGGSGGSSGLATGSCVNLVATINLNCTSVKRASHTHTRRFRADPLTESWAGGAFGGCASVELLNATDSTPIKGYSGDTAATVAAGADGVALPLVFGDGGGGGGGEHNGGSGSGSSGGKSVGGGTRVLPRAARTDGPGVRIKVVFVHGAILHGISLRCEPGALAQNPL